MSLAPGDYHELEQKVVAALLADTDIGGLREQGSPPVATIRAGGLDVTRAFGNADYPAILIRSQEKREVPSNPAYSSIKIFSIETIVVNRDMDRETAEDILRKIVARLEIVLRDQTATDKQFEGLPDFIEGSEGVLVSVPQRTIFFDTDAAEDGVVARAAVEAEVQLPCIFRYE